MKDLKRQKVTELYFAWYHSLFSCRVWRGGGGEQVGDLGGLSDRRGKGRGGGMVMWLLVLRRCCGQVVNYNMLALDSNHALGSTLHPQLPHSRSKRLPGLNPALGKNHFTSPPPSPPQSPTTPSYQATAPTTQNQFSYAWLDGCIHVH